MVVAIMADCFLPTTEKKKAMIEHHCFLKLWAKEIMMSYLG